VYTKYNSFKLGLKHTLYSITSHNKLKNNNDKKQKQDNMINFILKNIFTIYIYTGISNDRNKHVHSVLNQFKT